MKKKFRIVFNPFFMVPFVGWLLLGGLLMLCFDKYMLFFLINSNNNKFLDVLMERVTIFGEAKVVIPILLVPFTLKRFRNWRYFVSATLCNFVPFVLQQCLKYGFDAPRPMNFFRETDIPLHFLPSWELLFARSFPSGHSVGAFSLFCFLANILPAKYAKMGAFFFFAAALVGYSRVYLTAHYFTDVFVGSFVGVGLTTLAYSLMEWTTPTATKI
jgi:membrane-associated phospholipid phosphatase